MSPSSIPPVPGSASEVGAVLRRWQLLAWWFLSALAVVLIPSFVKFHRPAWRLGSENEFQVLAAGMAILVSALAYESVGQIGSRTARLCKGLGLTLLSFGIAAALVTRSGVPLSRVSFGIACVVALLVMALRILVERGRWVGITVLAVVVAGVGIASVRSQPQIARKVEHDALPTEYYRLAIDKYPVTIGTELGKASGGALASAGDFHILAAAQGTLFMVRETAEGNLHITPAGLQVPTGVDEFVAAAKFPSYELRVTGLAASRAGDVVQLYAAFDAWDAAKNCFITRVARVTLTLNGQALDAGDWKTIYDSNPCLEATTGYDYVQTGGRVALGANGKLLLSLGDRGFNGRNGRALAEERDNDYGKVIEIDLEGQGSSIFTMGHRNPQGLTVSSRGRVWETEHGPQGGDEVNLLVAGGDYGWPTVSYGTDYGHFVWPYSPEARDHGAKNEPVFAFVPSIGISNLVEAHSSQFPAWDGDLIVSSLKALTLYRLRLRDARVIYAEPIEIEHRIRDLAWSGAGALLLWTDDGYLIRVSPAAHETVYDQCSGCHEPRGQMPALGPPLRSIVGRKVGEHFDFGYSPALRNLGGTWTESRLDDFLKDPSAYAPGTTMTFSGIPDDEQRAKVIAFLKEYE